MDPKCSVFWQISSMSSKESVYRSPLAKQLERTNVVIPFWSRNLWWRIMNRMLISHVRSKSRFGSKIGRKGLAPKVVIALTLSSKVTYQVMWKRKDGLTFAALERPSTLLMIDMVYLLVLWKRLSSTKSFLTYITRDHHWRKVILNIHRYSL